MIFNAKIKKQNRGFTLIELLVVIAIIGILSSVVLASLNAARAKARDAVRKSDLKQLQTALELYYNDYERYPITNTWYGYQTSGCGVAAGLSGSGGYIPDLAPTYIATLPIDPSRQFGGCSGYLYYSGGDEKNYKLLSHAYGPESFPSVGQTFYDPRRPTWAWMVCSGEPACSSW